MIPSQPDCGWRTALVERLAVVFARPAPLQRVIVPMTATPYFQARAHTTLAPLDPLACEIFVAAEEARAALPPKPPSQRLAQSPSDIGPPDRGSIMLGAVMARTAILAVACTQCSRSGRYRVATLIDQQGAGCAIPELRRVLVSDCPKRGDAHGGCDVWFPELPALFRGDDEGNGAALGLQDAARNLNDRGESSMAVLTGSNGMRTQTAAAARMRRYRARRAAGSVIVTFRLSRDGVALLAELGWLSGEDLRKPQAVRNAFNKFVNAAAAVGITPTDGRRVTRNN
jgi:hypothetical protein